MIALLPWASGLVLAIAAAFVATKHRRAEERHARCLRNIARLESELGFRADPHSLAQRWMMGVRAYGSERVGRD